MVGARRVEWFWVIEEHRDSSVGETDVAARRPWTKAVTVDIQISTCMCS